MSRAHALKDLTGIIANCCICGRVVDTRESAEEALKPFAEAADSYDPDEGDGRNAAWAHDFTIGSLRAARDREGGYF